MSLSPGVVVPWRTFAREAKAEIKIRKSVFIGIALYLTHPSEFRSRLGGIRMEYGSANHCCHAFRVVWPRFDEYFSDDGEPSGSSGRPILNQMRRRGLDQGLMVVVRFFGGIKLGIPGLIEAYGEAARLALEAAKLTPFVPLTSIRIHCSLAEVGRLHGELARMGFSGEHIKESYGENGGVLSLKIPWDSVALLEDRLNEWTALGRVTNFTKGCEEISMNSHRGMSN